MAGANNIRGWGVPQVVFFVGGRFQRVLLFLAEFEKGERESRSALSVTNSLTTRQEMDDDGLEELAEIVYWETHFEGREREREREN